MFHNKKPSFLELARSVALSGPPSFVAGTDLDFCNPVSFYPFASAINVSVSLRKKLMAIEPNAQARIELASMMSDELPIW